MFNRKQAPPITDAVHFELQLPPAERYTLRNGIDVCSVNAGAEEVFAVEWVFDAGNCMETKNLVAGTTNFLLRNGTNSRTAFQINDHFEYYGSYLNRSCFNETAVISLHALSKHAAELLPVVRELISDSVMPATELEIYKQNMKQRLKVNLQKSDFVAGRMIDVYLYGEQHPYGRYSRLEDFDALQREELLAFHDRYYRNGSLRLFVAGKLPDGLPELLDRHFGDLPNLRTQRSVISASPATEKKYRIVNNEKGMQGSIRIARPFPNRHHPDFIRVMVLNTLFGGFFGSRLMGNIREDKGYTYGIHSYIQNHVGDSAWVISTEAGRDVCEATIAEVYKEMAALRDELVDEDELLLVRNYLMGGILGDLDGPFQVIARWKNILLNDLTEAYFYDTIRTIRSITAEEIRDLARRYLDPADFYELVAV
ncbi:MAG: hypothetical protein RJA57_592 [Bacteroidota bacterium]